MALPRLSRAAARSSGGALPWVGAPWPGGAINQSRIAITPFKYTTLAAARLSSVLSLARHSETATPRSISDRLTLSHFERVLPTAESAVSVSLGTRVECIAATSGRSGYLGNKSLTSSNALGDSGPVNLPAAIN